MNLFYYHMNFKLLFQILLLLVVYFNDIFGCISDRIREKDFARTHKLNIQALQNTVEGLLRNEGENEVDLITAFQTFLLTKYKWSVELSELNFYWTKLQEFSVQNGYLTDSCSCRRPKKIIKYYNPNLSYMTLEKIESYLENEDKQIKLIGTSSIERSPMIHSSYERSASSRFEKYNAFIEGKYFTKYACTLRNETFCVTKFLREASGIEDIFQVIPPAILLNRCPNRCNCLQPNEDCLPTAIRNRTVYINTFNYDQKESSRALVLVDHVDCKCTDRCLEKKCISFFEMKHNDDKSCKCECSKGHQKTCNKILKGYRNFSESDYDCIIGGQCIIPDCKAGRLSEELLYLRRCPQVSY